MVRRVGSGARLAGFETHLWLFLGVNHWVIDFTLQYLHFLTVKWG